MAKQRPSIDHSLLSPNGRMSKRARRTAMKREEARLFKDIDPNPQIPQPTEAENLRQHATLLRELADRGMSTRKFRRVAAEQEAKADALEKTEREKNGTD